MKTISTIIFLTLSLTSFCQNNTKTVEEKNYFILLYTIGENWDTTKQAHEQLYFSEHSAFLNKLRKSGKLLVGARYHDTGMLIIQGKMKAEVQITINQDPAVQNSIFRADIYPFYPFYGGCIE